MKISRNCVVSVDYSLHLGDGIVIDQSESEPLSYLHGTHQIVPGLEKLLEGMEEGQTGQFVVPPEDGYGPRDAAAVREVPRTAFGDRELKAGDSFVAVDPEENHVPVRIEKVAGDTVTVDFNHPLAGRTLHFSITVKKVREASPEELSHGHAHGGDGHHH